ncbi:MAG: retroviral-like aspartic protease family protein [Fimbriiglobus sp.]
MGKVLVTAKIENLNDVFEVEAGHRSPDAVRRVEIRDAMVDTGATMLMLPKRYVQQLGLKKFRSRVARTAGGNTEFGVYGMVLLTVDGREARVEVGDLPDENPVLIGQIPLEILDFLVDAQGHRLIGNPAHGGEQMFEVWSVFPPDWNRPQA